MKTMKGLLFASVVVLSGLISGPAWSQNTKLESNLVNKLQGGFERFYKQLKTHSKNLNADSKLMKVETLNPHKEQLSLKTNLGSDDFMALPPVRYNKGQFILKRNYVDVNDGFNFKEEVVCKGSLAIPVFDVRNMIGESNYYLDFNQWLTCWGLLDGRNVRYYLGGVIVYSKILSPFSVPMTLTDKNKNELYEIKNFSVQIFTELLDMDIDNGDNNTNPSDGINKWVDISTKDMKMKQVYMSVQRNILTTQCSDTIVVPDPTPVDPELPRISEEDGLVPPTDPIECAFPDSVSLVVELND